MFTPRPCPSVSELVFGNQACGQLVKVRSAESESERKTERNDRASRSFITITGLDRNPRAPAVRKRPRPQLSPRIQVREKSPANASAKSPSDRDGCPKARPAPRPRFWTAVSIRRRLRAGVCRRFFPHLDTRRQLRSRAFSHGWRSGISIKARDRYEAPACPVVPLCFPLALALR